MNGKEMISEPMYDAESVLKLCSYPRMLGFFTHMCRQSVPLGTRLLPVFFSVVCTLCTLQYKLTPLMYAAGEGHTDVVQVVLSQQDVDINMRDEVCPSQWKLTLTNCMVMYVVVDKV